MKFIELSTSLSYVTLRIATFIFVGLIAASAHSVTAASVSTTATVALPTPAVESSQSIRVLLGQILDRLVQLQAEAAVTATETAIYTGLEGGGSVAVLLVNETGLNGVLDWGDGTRTEVQMGEVAEHQVTHQYRASGSFPITYRDEAGTVVERMIRVRL